jgi:hypothetical protein
MALLQAATLAGLIAMQPHAAAAIDKPSPATLRATLADPFTGDFVEADPGTPNVLEGPFDAQIYANSFQLDPTTQGRLIESLNKEGFISGYARTWYKAGSRIFMGESVLAFQAVAGATSSSQLSKVQYGTSPAFTSFQDVAIPHSFAVKVHEPDGFNWTVVIFTKGNGLYVITVGSESDYMDASTRSQADKEYEFAPLSISASTSHPSALAGGLAFGTALVVSLLLLAALGSVVVASVLIFHNARNPWPVAGPKPQTFTLPPEGGPPL